MMMMMMMVTMEWMTIVWNCMSLGYDHGILVGPGIFVRDSECPIVVVAKPS